MYTDREFLDFDKNPDDPIKIESDYDPMYINIFNGNGEPSEPLPSMSDLLQSDPVVYAKEKIARGAGEKKDSTAYVPYFRKNEDPKDGEYTNPEQYDAEDKFFLWNYTDSGRVLADEIRELADELWEMMLNGRNETLPTKEKLLRNKLQELKEKDDTEFYDVMEYIYELFKNKKDIDQAFTAAGGGEEKLDLNDIYPTDEK